MLIQVTQEHIDNGVRGECALCPVALALHERFKGLHYPYGVLVHSLEIRIRQAAFKPSPAVKKFIRDFDAGRKVSPFTFEI